MAEPRHEPLRADAQQNRERILEAARVALAASGEASLNSIAKRAGVGPGTLYRHFPSREALILAVYRYDVQQLADAAPDLLAHHPPIEALRLWSDRLANYGLIKHGLAGALDAASSDGLAGETYDPVVGAIRLLLTACEQDGSMRPGHHPDDVLLLLAFLWRIDRGPGASARTARLLDIVISGLCAGAAAPERPARGYRRARRLPRTRRTSRLSLLSILRTRPQAHQAETAAPPGPRA
ncbi:MAG: TetR/AcrR family transcriptional regulator [Streptosporangiaceae bacterium]